MVVVSDTSPIANLIVIDKLYLLETIFEEVLIPEKVYNEISALEDFNYDLTDFKNAKWIIKKSITDFITYQKILKLVDEGEAEGITLAKELNADFLLIDENKGRKIANENGLKTVGLLGILLKAKERKYIPQIKNVLDQLKNEASFWISDELYSEVLKSAGE